tara:strand:+ start:449 stop:763 length:315 start_codon:yes stop_codon:yes gene_type:complete
MNTKQQIDNLKIGDTIMVYRKGGNYVSKGPRNIKNGYDPMDIVRFTKTEIQVCCLNGWGLYRLKKDSFTTSWDLKYPEIVVPPAPDYPAVWLNGEWQNVMGVGY